MHSIESPPVGLRFVWTISWICVVLSTGTISQEMEHRMCNDNIAALVKRTLPHRLGQSTGHDCQILSLSCQIMDSRGQVRVRFDCKFSLDIIYILGIIILTYKKPRDR